MDDDTLEAFMLQLGIDPQRSQFQSRDRFTTRRPIDPSSPTTSVAGQIAPTIRREDLRPLPTREEQRRQYDQLQQRPRQVEAYQDPRNQFAEAGQYGLEMTGLPSIRRSAGAFADGRPQDGVEEGAMGALSLATLGVGGRGARAPRPAPMRAPMPEAPPQGALRLPPSSDPLDVFHGTNRQIDGSLRPGNDGVVWSTTNPEQASYLAARRSPEGANVMPGRVTPDGYEIYDSGGQSLNPMERQRIIDEARARGARGVVFRNDRDGVAGTGDNVASFDGADFAPRAGALRPPPRQLGTASDGSVMPVREPQPFRQSMVGGSDDLAEAARPRGALDAGNGGAGRVTRTGGGGFIEYEASPDGWRITDVQLDPALRGKGNGVALYEQMLEEAAAAGVTRVFSDNIVSQSAEPIYAALRRRGYTVTASPRSAVTRHPNNPRLFLEREDGQPIFTVSTQRARSPTPPRQQ